MKNEKYDCLVYKIRSAGGSFSCRTTMVREKDAKTTAGD